MSETCQHIHIVKVANMGKGTYKCEDCPQKFKVQEWDGKLVASYPEDRQVQP